jgi:hypothetical protein
MYHGRPRVKKSTFFVVAGLTNLVWEKLEPLPRFSAVIGQKTDIWTKFGRFFNVFLKSFAKWIKVHIF